MKTFIRGLLFVLGTCILLLFLGLVLLSLPGVQKRIVEELLPAGSTVGSVHLTPGTLELSQLKLALPDGTAVDLAQAQAGFHLLALLERKIKLDALTLDGFAVRMPRPDLRAVAAPVTALPHSVPVRTPQGTAVPASSDAGATRVIDSAAAPAATQPLSLDELLEQCRAFEWLLEAESLSIEGTLTDSVGALYRYSVSSEAIKPGAKTVLRASFNLISGTPALSPELADLRVEASLSFIQQPGGALQMLGLQTDLSAKDAQGEVLFQLSQRGELSIGATDADAEFSVQADLPRPELMLPEWSELGAVHLDFKAQGGSEGDALTLKQAQVLALAAGRPLLEINLLQPLTWGEPVRNEAVIASVSLTELPYELFTPWLQGQLELSGNPISAELLISGNSEGGLQLHAPTPWLVGPVSIQQAGRPLLDGVSVVLDPEIQLSSEGVLDFELKTLQFSDRYGVLGQGQLTARYDPIAGTLGARRFDGLRVNGELQLGLAALFQQPVLVDQASVIGGQLYLGVEIEPEQPDPLQLQLSIEGLRGHSLSPQTQDYRIAAKLHEAGIGEWVIAGQIEAGPLGDSSTQMDYRGQLTLGRSPLPVVLRVSGSQVTQADFDVLLSAVELPPQRAASVALTDLPAAVSIEAKRATAGPKPAPAVLGAGESAAVPVSDVAEVMPPPWAEIDGSVELQFERIVTNFGFSLDRVQVKATVKESLLDLSELSFGLGEGSLHGRAAIAYDLTQALAYALNADLEFQQIDPSAVTLTRGSPVPLQGRFDGHFKVAGDGASLPAAVDSVEFDLLINGANGALTAFELDNRSQIGLGLGGLLGQALDRPELTALSRTIPYFQNMKFKEFVIELTRGPDQRIAIPQLKFAGDHVLLQGAGSVGGSELRSVMQQPLELNLELGAKGALIDHLQTLNLLSPQTTAEGYRRWSTDVKLRGTLAKPDTSALMDILKRAGSSVLSPESSSLQSQPTQGNKAADRAQEVEMGIQLLKSIFGK
ncbi:MAG: hypothetical protein ACI81V_001335 [Lentimonas sp.]|jgi:hypothetical protein